MKNGLLKALVIFGFVIGFMLNINEIFGFGVIEEKIDMQYRGQTISEIRINAPALAVEIKQGDDFGVRIGQGKGLECSLKNGCLSVTQDENNGSGRGRGRDYRLFVYIPEGQELTDISVMSSAGAVEISDIKADNISIITDAGAIEIENTECPMYNLQTAVGAVDVEIDGNKDDYAIHTSTSLGIATVNGDVYKNTLTSGTKALNVSTDIGAIEIDIN